MSPQPRIVNLDGVKHTFPPDATDDEIRQALERTPSSPPAPPKPPLPNELRPESQQDNSFWSSPHGLIRTGLREAGRGVAALTRPTADEKMGAVSQIVRGAGKAVSPAAIPLAIANPVTAAAATVGGFAGGKVAGYGSRKLGAGPGGQALAEDVGNLAGGAAGARIGAEIVPGVRAAFRPKLDVGTAKAWSPPPGESDFPQVAPEALSEVKTFGNPRIRTNAETKEAAGKTIKALQDGLEKWIADAKARGVKIPGDSIVKATADAIPEVMKLEDPEGAKGIVSQAQQAYGGRQFDPDYFRELLREKNAGSSGFYKKSEAGARASMGSGAPPAIEKTQAEAIREALYRFLDPDNDGAGPREIQQRTGRVYDLLDAADRRANAIVKEHSVSPAETVGKVAAGLVNLPGKIFHGDTEGAINALRAPGMGPTEALIERLFASAPDAKPIPVPSRAPRNLNPNRALPPGSAPFTQGTSVPDVLGRPDLRREYNAGLLGPGQEPQTSFSRPAIVTPPPEDGSFVRSVPAITQPPNPRRALPPAPNIHITPPPSEPDGSFVRSVPGMQQPPNPSRAITQGDIIPPSDFHEPVFGPVHGHYPNAPNPRRALPSARTFLSPKYGPPDMPEPRGVPASTTLPPAMEGSSVHAVRGEYPGKIDTTAPGFGQMPSDETIAQRLSKAILGGNQ